MKKKLLGKYDIAIIIAVLAVCLGSFLLSRQSGGSLNAQVLVGGEVFETLNLEQIEEPVRIITPTEPQTVIIAEKGCIYFESSQCENQLCVRSGRLTRKGAAAVCLPAGVVITIKGGTVDAVTY